MLRRGCMDCRVKPGNDEIEERRERPATYFSIDC
jgi:hypothetical protein